MSTKPSILSLHDYLWSHVEKSDGCWFWTRCVDKGGYGAFTYRRKVYKAHRVAYEAVHGPITRTQHVCHSCDNPRCCNPDHLFLGDSRINILDATHKGRMRKRPTPTRRPEDFHSRKGSANGRARLTEESVREARRLYREGNVTAALLADRFGAPRATMAQVLARITWQHVTD